MFAASRNYSQQVRKEGSEIALKLYKRNTGVVRMTVQIKYWNDYRMHILSLFSSRNLMCYEMHRPA